MDKNNIEISQNEKAGGYISKIQFNNNLEVEFKENDIVIFVGPNNVGKSQALSDIFDSCESQRDNVIVRKIKINKFNGRIYNIFKSIGVKNNEDEYNISGQNFYYGNDTDNNFIEAEEFHEYRNLFVVKIDTQTRLSISDPVPLINRHDSKSHPIHYAAFDKDIRKRLSDNFKKAFGEYLIPNTNYGISIPLCIGEPVNLKGKYIDEQERQEAYASILDQYKQVQDQGDGIKSFTGILLYLILDYFCIYLIDEPESFLHPPQAKIMGEIIGETLSSQQQAFI